MDLYEEFPREWTVRWGRWQKVQFYGIFLAVAACLGCILIYRARFAHQSLSDGSLTESVIVLFAALIFGGLACVLIVTLVSWGSGENERIRSQVAAMKFKANAEGINRIVNSLVRNHDELNFHTSDSATALAIFTAPQVSRRRTLWWLRDQWEAVCRDLARRAKEEPPQERRRFDVTVAVWRSWRENRGVRIARPGRSLTISRQGAAVRAARGVGVHIV